ncbi:MAG: D-alanine--D-alanine ligase [Deltaproteobacteria bacterium]|nr:MAG: D-alanine--D-alanine ligase [Deltaproteobacteria bacterium]
MKKIKVAIIAGGYSAEREVSLKSGWAVYNALNREKYDPEIWDIGKDLDLIFRKRDNIDIAFPLLHGRLGEDGCIQGFLKILDIPFVGSDVLASAMAMNKKISKEIFKARGLCVPRDVLISKNREFSLSGIMLELGFPVVVKPVAEGSSFGISICHNEEELRKGIENAFEYDDEPLLEEYIKGREVTAPVIGNDELEVLPIVEIVPKPRYQFFDFEAKYTPGATDEICPADLPASLEEVVRRCARVAFRALGCKTWARVDMILNNNKAYILEVNTIPGMTENSLFPLSARKAGIDFSGLLDRLISISLKAYVHS